MSHLAPPNQSQALQARLLAERREREWLQQRVTEMGQELAMARESSTNASPEKGDMLRTDDTCSPARSDGSSAASSTHSSPEVIELRSRLEMTETKHGNLLATLREREELLDVKGGTISEYQTALSQQDQLLQKATRLIAQEKKKSRDLQALLDAQAERMIESDEMLEALYDRGLPRAAETETSASTHLQIPQTLLIKCATCGLMASMDDLTSHVADCEAMAQQRRYLTVTVTAPRYNVADPLQSTVKVASRTDVSEYRGTSFTVERRAEEFAEFQRELEERYPTRVVPPLAAQDRVMDQADWVLELQRFCDRVSTHTVLRLGPEAISFFAGQPDTILATPQHSPGLTAPKMMYSSSPSPVASPQPSPPAASNDLADDPNLAELERDLTASQTSLAALAEYFRSLDAMRNSEVTMHQKATSLFRDCARTEGEGSYLHDMATTLSSLHRSLQRISLQDNRETASAIESLSQFTAAAVSLTQRYRSLLTSMTLRRKSIDSAPSSPNLDSDVEDLRVDFRIASQQLLEFRRVFWDEIQHFEEQKTQETKRVLSEHTMRNVESHYQLLGKWTAVSSTTLRPAVPRSPFKSPSASAQN